MATATGKPPLWWRVVRGTVVGTAKVAYISYIEGRFIYGVTKTRTKMRYRRWQANRNFAADETPEIDEVPRKRRRLLRPQYVCMACGRKYSSARGLNKHFGGVHGSEPIRNRLQPPRTILGRDGAEKVLIQLPVARQTGKTTTTASRSGNPMNSTIALALKGAWARMAEARPRKLSEIRDDMVGLEQVLGGIAADAITEYRAHLVRNVGFDPVTVQRLLTAITQLQEAGKSFSAVIATIDEVYAADIAAARRRKGGARPSDDTLTS